MSTLNNQTLRTAEDAIEWRLKRGSRDWYQRLLIAGIDAAMHGGPDSILVSLRDSKHGLRDAAVAALDLCFSLRKQRDDVVIPLVTTVAAARALMVHALFFMEKVGAMNIGPAELEQASDFFNRSIFTRLMICNQSSHGAPRTQYRETVERAVATVVWLPDIAASPHLHLPPINEGTT